MSFTSKLTFAISTTISGGIIAYVHIKQTNEREELHKGVLRDIERRQRPKVDNIYDLHEQINFTENLEQQTDSADSLNNQNIT